MTLENEKIAVGLEWKRARESLEAARTLLKVNLFRDSISTAYYSIFHAGTAALLMQSVEAKSHKEVKALFSLHF